MGARTFPTPVAFAQAAILSRASGSGSEGWKTRAGKCLAKCTICSPEPLAISRMTPVVGRTSRRTSRINLRLRSVAGAYWRSSLIVLTLSGNFGHRIANGQRATSAIRALFRAGVDHVMDYRTEYFEARARQIPGGRKVELAIGGDSLKVIAHTCRPAGSGRSEYRQRPPNETREMSHAVHARECGLASVQSRSLINANKGRRRQPVHMGHSFAYGAMRVDCQRSSANSAPPATKL